MKVKMKTYPVLKIVCCVTLLLLSTFHRGDCQSITPTPPLTPPVPIQEVAATIQEPSAPAQDLPMFGHNLFAINGEHLGQVSMIGVMFPATYRLGPGDRLGIFLLGKIQQNFDVIINVEGKIFIPNVGLLYVANLTINECTNLLEQHLAKYYSNFSVSLMLVEPKKVSVMVVGDVQRPGKYFLSSLNTVFDAVIMTGGPTESGSLRNIQIYRQNKLLTIVDLYGFLMTGDCQNDVFLYQNDRIVIPLMDAVVSISGEVKRQARFELKNNSNEKLSDLIYLAGGFTELAYLQKIEISRLLPHGERSVSYVDYRKIFANDSCNANLALRHGDKIHVYSLIEQNCPKYVYIHGEVKRPGRYELEQNLRALDLIVKAGNLTRSAYLLECEVAKIDPKLPTQFKQINLQSILIDPNHTENILLEEDDRLFIRQIPEWQVGLTIEIKGEVQFPGVYAITKDSTTLSEIMDKAGGFTSEALIREASLVRPSAKIITDKEYERLKELSRDQMSKTEYEYLVMKQNALDVDRIAVDFFKLCIKKDLRLDVILEDGDVINVPKAPKVVYVTGRVGKPGGVLHSKGQDIKYYLDWAGGPAWDARVSGIKVTKVTGEIVDDEKVNGLEPGDIIWVPRKPDRDLWEIFRQTMTIVAQLATAYIVVDRAVKRD